MQQTSLKTTYFVDSLAKGGTQALLINLIPGLAQQEFSQTVLCLNNDVDSFIYDRLKEHANVVVIGKFQLLTGIGFLRILKHVLGSQIVMTYLPFSDVIGRIFAKLCRIPLIISTIHAKNEHKNRIQLMLDRATMRFADRVIFNSSTVIPFAIANEGVESEQSIYIPNGIDLDVPVNHDFSREIQEKYSSQTSGPLLGSIGRLTKQKGYGILLEAMPDIIAKQPDVRLVIMGDGPLREELEQKVISLGLEKNVFLPGSLDFKNIPAFLHSLTLYLQPSLFEGMSVATMQAMEAGLPVIATRTDGVKEMMTDQQEGWIVEINNTKDLTEKTIYVLENPEKSREIGSQARQKIRREYSMERMIDRHAQLMQERLKARTGISHD